LLSNGFLQVIVGAGLSELRIYLGVVKIFPKNIHEHRDMAHALKTKTTSEDTISMGKG
jgi:hypothetical protein